MKPKALLLVALAAAGAWASIAVAGNGHGKPNGSFRGWGHGRGCRAVNISGTAGPQTLVITVSHAGRRAPANGSTVTVTIGGAGQTVRADVGECTGRTGTGTTATTTVRSVDLIAVKTRPTPPTTTVTTTTSH